MKMNKKYITVIALAVALITPFACSKRFFDADQYISVDHGCNVSEIIRCGIPDQQYLRYVPEQ